MRFVLIDLEKHQTDIIRFRKDSFKVSFGDTSNFNEHEYLGWLSDKKSEFPDGFVLIEDEDKYIGQLELTIREYDGKKIGYVNLCYLIPEMRGKGKGRELHKYTKQFFENHHLDEYHLRVSPTNQSAINFYRKIGMKEVGPEMDGKVLRMKGNL